MNKLPWFTHDHDAHDDEFLQDSMDKFSHFGYAAYFITLELLHKHGHGDVMEMKLSRFVSHLRSRTDSVMKWLRFLRLSGKASWEVSQDGSGHGSRDPAGVVLRIEIENFRKRQSKMKSKIPSTFPYIKKENKNKKENNIPGPVGPGGFFKDPLQKRLPWGPKEGVHIGSLGVDEAQYFLTRWKGCHKWPADIKEALQARIDFKKQEAKR